MPRPLISVVVPVYNVEAYLRRCLDSVLAQSFTDFELICVNDGSTDSSPSILVEYAAKDSRISVINQENGGVSEARNTGIEVAKGEYLSFIDSDDWIDRDFLEKLYTAARAFDADIVQSGYRKIGNRKTKEEGRIEAEGFDFISKYASLMSGYVTNKLFSCNLIKKYHLRFPKALLFEDSLFTVQSYYYAEKIKMIDYCGYNYFFNALSIVNNPQKEKKRLVDGLEIARQIMSFGQEKNLGEAELAVFKDYIATHLLWEDYLGNKEYYQNYFELLGDNEILAAKKRKIQKRNRFYLSFRKKKLVIGGIYFIGK